MTDLKIAGAQKHETDVAERLGGRKTRGSGSQWHDKGDGRNDHFSPFAFAWDCKSTQRMSISVTLAMLEKIREEAHGDRPALPLRFYANSRLDVAEDWILVKLDDFTELLETARQAAGAVILAVPDHLSDEDLAKFQQHLEEVLAHPEPMRAMHAADNLEAWDRGQVGQLSAALARTQESEARTQAKADLAEENVAALQRQLDEARDETAALRAALQASPPELEPEPEPEPEPEGIRSGPPMDIPRLPWTIITTLGTSHAGIEYDRFGHPHPFPVREVRTEPTSATTERLMVDNRQIREGDLYVGGKLRLRVGA